MPGSSNDVAWMVFISEDPAFFELVLPAIAFASTNYNKYREVMAILSEFGISADFLEIKIPEMQSDSLEDIATEKAKSAYLQVPRPLIVEDDGLFIQSLKGFPGPYSSYVFGTIGNDGILRLLDNNNNNNNKARRASFRSIISYFDGKNSEQFSAEVMGSIIMLPAGGMVEKEGGGWGYDPIFAPDGANGLTFGDLKERKSEFSHRKKALEKFARWYLLLHKG